jgi:predicted outer membrane repeat protein
VRVLVLTVIGLFAEPASAATLSVCSTCTYKTIASAVTAAAAGDTISVGAGTWAESVTVSKSVTITGAGSSTVITGSGASQVVAVAVGVTASFQDLAIAPSSGGRCMSVNSSAKVTWTRVDCSGATPTSSSGGGITASSATLTLTDSTFDANASAGCCYYGGHVYVSGGSLTVTGSTFTNGTSGRGAALGIVNGANVTISDSTFSGNTSDQEGGAIYLKGGSGSPTFSLAGSTFEGNAAGRGGGAIYWEQPSDVSISDTLFCGNSADQQGGAIYWKRSDGGAMEVTNSRFVENTTLREGGAIYFDNLNSDYAAVVNNVFLGNSALYRGSALYYQDSQIWLTNSVIAWNTGAEAIDGGGSASSSSSYIAYDMFWDNALGDGFETYWDASVLTEEPELSAYTLDGDCGNDELWPTASSNLVDAGDPTLSDPDGSVSDIGAYGGPDAGADSWTDADADGWYAMWDCSDADATSYPVSWYLDGDADGYGETSTGGELACDAPSGYVADDGDCDDADATAFPGAVEVCDGVDHDCDGASDEPTSSDASTWYDDSDGDGYGDPSTATTACDAPAGYVSDGSDCDDGTALVRPGGAEACDGLDNDCDGSVDEVTPTWYRDADGDGYGTPSVSATTCTMPSGYVGYAGDCNDGSAAVNPDAIEACNGYDDDCDGSSDEGVKSSFYRDADGDGFGTSATTTTGCSAPSGYVSAAGDCDDGASAVSPSASEACNAVDDDCDGATDEGVKPTWYRDSDKDGYGATSSSVSACSAPSGFVGTGGDCNDAASDVSPGATETCNGVDDDCDLSVDDGVSVTLYLDDDADGHGDASSSTSACGSLPGYVTSSDDCDDAAADVYLGAPELCDSKDNDCDGSTDESPPTWYRDSDGDGYGTSTSTKTQCSASGGFVLVGGDCNDASASVSPGEAEVCDGADQDCDGTVDDGVTSTWYTDADGDGYGASGSTGTDACAGATGTVANDDDCDDTDVGVSPAALEACNGTDDDCDGVADDDAIGAVTYYVDADGDGLGDALLPELSCSALAGYATNADDCDDAEASVGAERDWYADYDSDGYGVSSETATACEPPVGYAGEPGDCDDADGGVHPDAAEAPNGYDEDCDGIADDGTSIYDDDGDGRTEAGGDCDDGDPEVNPGGLEECDGIDEDCSGVVDDGTACYDDDGDSYDELVGDCDDANPDVNPGAIETDGNGIDDDCDGDVDHGTWDADGDGVTEAGGDCAPEDDTIYPGATEIVDDEDNDCDGEVDEDTEISDDDGDGFAEVQDDCDDADDTVFPGAPEAADGVDDDCDGTVDEGTNAYDDDGDGVTEDGGDCDDASAAVRPGATELDNDLDDDCDGQIDEDLGGDTDTPDDTGTPDEEKRCGCAMTGVAAGFQPAAALLLIGLLRRRKS